MSIRDRSESRDGYAVRVLAVHTSEGIDKPVVDDAAALRDASWWVGSSHAIADNDPGSLLTPAEGCVPYDRASWTLRSGNRWSENIELIAQAGWTRAQWLARPKLLDNCARWLADRSKARGIPLVKLTPQQYRAGGRGVIGHNDHTVGYSDGTHWDPGPGFPWDVVLDKARAYAKPTQPAQEEDMPIIIVASGRPKAVLAEGFFIPMNEKSDEPKNWGAAGAKEVWVMPGTWDLYHAAQNRGAALLEQIAAKPAAAAAGAVTIDVPDGFAAQLADAVNDEGDRRGRDGDPATGPVS